MAEDMRTQAPLITDEDVHWLIGGCDFTRDGDITSASVRWALETTAPRLRARWVAEALEKAADDSDFEPLRWLAAEYRDGKR